LSVAPTVTAAGDDEARPSLAARPAISVAWPGRWSRRDRSDAAGSKNMARRIERATAAVSAAAGVGIVNQQSVRKSEIIFVPSGC